MSRARGVRHGDPGSTPGARALRLSYNGLVPLADYRQMRVRILQGALYVASTQCLGRPKTKRASCSRSSVVERPLDTRKVAGSKPAGCTARAEDNRFSRGSSMVERRQTSRRCGFDSHRQGHTDGRQLARVIRRRGGTGRRAGLRVQWPKGRGGSSPLDGTTFAISQA